MLQFICFSRYRPLQLHGYLTSLFKHCPEEVAVSVLYKSDPGYVEAYHEIRGIFPYVHFLEETDFKSDLQTLVDRSAAEFLSFGCDDVVFVAPLLVREIERAFGKIIGLLGLSLRLGEHITEDMYGRSLPSPELWLTDKWLRWDMTTAIGDWAYPWEVLGTIYKIDFVREMIKAIQPGSPSQLEERGTHIWSSHTTDQRLAAWVEARIVVPTVNMIQREFSGNGIRGSHELTPGFLLSCWQNGLRMDIDRYIKMTPPSWRIGDFYLKSI